jgi:hypothetical protein
MDILRKRTFPEDTASAKVETNSGDMAMPEVADMVIGNQHKFNYNSDEHSAVRSLPGLQGASLSQFLLTELKLLPKSQKDILVLSLTISRSSRPVLHRRVRLPRMTLFPSNPRRSRNNSPQKTSRPRSPMVSNS